MSADKLKLPRDASSNTPDPDLIVSPDTATCLHPNLFAGGRGEAAIRPHPPKIHLQARQHSERSERSVGDWPPPNLESFIDEVIWRGGVAQ